MPSQAHPQEIDAVGTLLRPGQTIAIDKLLKLINEKLGPMGREKLYAIKREMMRRGFMTEKLRRGPALLTFHNPPLPREQRQEPVTKPNRRKVVDDLITPQPSVVTNADRIERLTTRLRQRELKIRNLEADVRDIKAQLREILG